jgi:hypothetical protein
MVDGIYDNFSFELNNVLNSDASDDEKREASIELLQAFKDARSDLCFLIEEGVFDSTNKDTQNKIKNEIYYS